MPSPFDAAVETSNRKSERAMLDVGRVEAVDKHETGDQVQHIVNVNVRGENSPVNAIVPIQQHGDINVPSVDDKVFIAYDKREFPIVVATYYETSEDSAPPYEEGERRVGHHPTGSHFHIYPDGRITLERDDGKVIRMDDNVVELEHESGATVTIQSNGDVKIHSPGQVSLGDENGTYADVARKGDAIETDGPDATTGQITGGSSNVQSS